MGAGVGEREGERGRGAWELTETRDEHRHLRAVQVEVQVAVAQGDVEVWELDERRVPVVSVLELLVLLESRQGVKPHGDAEEQEEHVSELEDEPHEVCAEVAHGGSLARALARGSEGSTAPRTLPWLMVHKRTANGGPSSCVALFV